MRKIITGLALFSATAIAWGQVRVDQTSAAPNIYVDSAKGSDASPGTQQQPYRTLNQAVKAAVAQSKRGIATKITVAPGTYRETLTVAGATAAPVTIVGASGGSVVSGADVWTGWKLYSGSIYSRSWPYKWGYCAQLPGPADAPIVRRREMIFVNGVHLTQVLSLSQMAVGTFFVNESNSTVYIWPPSGTNVSSARIEVATRPTLLTVQGTHGTTISGITFRYANGCRNVQPAVTVSGSTGTMISNDSFDWNNSTALKIASSSGITVQSSHADHNGHTGIFLQYVENAKFTSDTASYNNWRGAQGGSYAWNVAGMKFGEVHDVSINGFQALYNQSHGVHLDTDIRNITIDSLVSSQNLRSGIQLEADPGPVTLAGAKICSNNKLQETQGSGVTVMDAAGVALTNSTLYNNGNAQILITGRQGGIAVRNYQTGITSQVYNQNFTQDSNTVESNGSQEVFEDRFLTQDWSRFANSLNSDYNTWWNGSSASAFMVPVPKGHTYLTFGSWKSLTKKDPHSVFASPGAVSCGVTSQGAAALAEAGNTIFIPEEANYWLVANGGPSAVNHGAEASYVFSIVPTGPTGQISMKADVSAIPGASASWSADSIEESGSSTVTIATDASTPPGTYPVTVIASSGDITRTLTVSVVVR